MSSKPGTIDEYLATVSPERRAALEAVRRAVHAVRPDAEEIISYSMPAFRVEGAVVAGFLATSRGCSYFPFSGRTLDALGDAIAGYGRTKSALHFDPKKGLPKALVRKLLAARLAERAPARKAPPKRVAAGAAPASTRKPTRARKAAKGRKPSR